MTSFNRTLSAAFTAFAAAGFIACTPSSQLQGSGARGPTDAQPAPEQVQPMPQAQFTQVPQPQAQFTQVPQPMPQAQFTQAPRPQWTPAPIVTPFRPLPTPGPLAQATPDTRINQSPTPAPQLNPIPQGQAQGTLAFKTTPFSNMEHGYQATNEGFRAILRDANNEIIAAGPMNMDAVMNGESCDSGGIAYSCLELRPNMLYVSNKVTTGELRGGAGKLSVCMARDVNAAYENSECQSLPGRASDRPFQWLNRGVNYTVSEGKLRVTSYSESMGEGGNALSVYHPAYGFAAPGQAFKDYQSPLVLDLNRDGKVSLSSVNENKNLRFDLMNTGKAVRTGWIGKGDALLAIDVNGNGKIDNGSELFGEYSAGRLPKAGELKSFENGFQALSLYDSNKDGRIDSQDAVFAKLVVWNDANGDGTSQAFELKSLAQASVKSLDLGYETTSNAKAPQVISGNEVRLTSSYTATDGKKHKLVDVWFQQSREVEVGALERK